MSEAMIDKVRALLRKTEAAGCTAEEADAAMKAAARLMQKHNIDRVMVENKEADAEAKRLNLVKEYVNTKRDKCYTDEHIMRILRQCFCLRVYYSHSYDWDGQDAAVAKYEARRKELSDKVAAGELSWADYYDQKGKYPKLQKRFVYVLVGDKPDVELGAQMIPEFRRIMRHGLAKHLREEGLGWTAVSADSFHGGFARGYIDANEVAQKEILIEAGATAANQYALAVVDKEKAVEEFAAQSVKTVRARANSGNGARSFGWDAVAAKKGVATGSKLNLKSKRLD